MPSLAHCIEKTNLNKKIPSIHPAEAERLQKAAAQYRSEGFKPQESNENAVRDYVKTLQADRADIVKQIEKQLPKVASLEAEVAPEGVEKPVKRGKAAVSESEIAVKGKKEAKPKYVKVVTPPKAKSTVGQVKTYVQKAIGKKKADNLINTGKIVLVEKETNLPTGLAAEGEGKILGMSQKGTVYLVAGNLDKKTTYPTLLHESIHSEIDVNGWEGLFGSHYDRIMNQYERLIKKGDPSLLAAQANAIAAGTPEAHLFEETLAYYVMSEANHNASLFKKILNAIRAWAVKNGFLGEVNAGDLVAIAQAVLAHKAKDKGTEKILRTGPASVFNEFAQTVGTKLSVAKKKITDNPAFNKWFKGSKIKDADGEPLVMYHGGKFDESIDGIMNIPGEGAFFAERKKIAQGYAPDVGREPRITEAYLSIKNPFMPFNQSHLDAKWVQDWIDSWRKKDGWIRRATDEKMSNDDVIQMIGDTRLYEYEPNVSGKRWADFLKTAKKHHDGFLGYDPTDASIIGVVFEPTQIKSIYNVGTFGWEESDVRFAREISTREYTKEQQKAMEEGGFGVRAKQTVKERLDVAKVRLGAKLRQGIIDQYDSFTRILKDDTAWMMAHLTKSDAGVLKTTINVGTPFLEESGSIDIKKDSKSLKDILAPLGKETDDFFKWIAGHRAERLKAEDRENLLSNENIEALKTLNQGNMADGSKRETVYKKALEEFEKIGAAVVQIGVDTGLINKKEAKTWKDEGWYIPFYRMLEDDKVRGPSNISALTGQKGYHKLKGASFQIEDLLSNVLMNWNHLISAGLRNQAGTKALESAEATEMAYKIPKATKSKKAIYVRKDGKEKWYEIEDSQDGKLVLSSLLSLNQECMNTPAMKVLRKFKRMLTIGVTASPGFKIRNLIRDTIHAAAVTTASPNIVKNVLTGWQYDTKRMEAGGGAFNQSGYIHGSDPDAVKQLLDSGIEQDTILNTLGKLKKLWQKYEDFGARLENVNRVAGFEEDIKKGKSLLEANFNARDQLDFSRTGSFTAIRFIAQTVPFLNARLQGLDKMGRSAMDKNQCKQFATVAGSYALASVLLYLMMCGDDDYKEAEDWEKRTYHLFKIPGSEKIYRIPRPFEVGALAYMAEKMTEQFVDKNAKIKDLGNALTHTLMDTFSFNPIPQAFKPLVEVYANKNMFTGRSIESLGMQRLSRPERFQPWTSEMMKGTSRVMSKVTPDSVTLSPVQLEHMVRAYTGWLGVTTLAGIDGAIKIVSGEVTPETKWYEYEPIKTLTRDPQARNTKYTTKFYDNLEELTQLYGDVQKYRGTGKGKKLRENAAEKLRWRRRYNRVSRLLTNLRKRRKAVYADNSLSSIEKRDKIDRFNSRINSATKKIVEKSDYFF